MKVRNVLLMTLLLFWVNTVMGQQPLSGCWHPEKIKNWTPEKDLDAKFNKSTVPLQPRFKDDGIKANVCQFYDGQVSACLTMNPECGTTPSQGANNFLGYNPTYWQYMDMLVWWGGSAAEGIIIPPSAPVTDAAHLNGVKVLGQIFFPPASFAGDELWVDQILTKQGGEYIYAKKLWEIADYFGFDGWFINSETPAEYRPADWEGFVQTFNKYKKQGNKNHMEIKWYDTGKEIGQYMNFLKLDGTSYFLDYTSPSAGNISTQMKVLQDNSITKENAFKKLYFGLEIPQNSIDGNAEYFKNIFSKTGHNASVDLFNPEEVTWKKVVENYLNTPSAKGTTAYTAQKKVFDNEARFWTNSANNPTNKAGWESGVWPGLANAVQERSAIQSKPFVTSFSTGFGKQRFVNGIAKSIPIKNSGDQDWYHRGMQDVLPTWRWWIESSTDEISLDYNWDDAYNVGTSLKVTGKLTANQDHLVRFYKTKLQISTGDKFQLVYKTTTANSIEVKLATSENKTQFITIPVSTSSNENGWNVVEYDLSSLSGKTLSIIALNFKVSTTVNSYSATLGQMGVLEANYNPSSVSVTNLMSQNKLGFDNGNIRLTWNAPQSKDVHHYNVYLERNGIKGLVGQTRNEGFYIETFNRSSLSEKGVKVMVTTVTNDLKEGAEVSLSLDFALIDQLELRLRADKTILKVGESVKIEAFSTQFQVSYEWTTPSGATKVSSSGNNAVFSFSKEGAYDIIVKATTAAGTITKTMKGLVEVSNADPVCVSVGKKIHSASGYINGEYPENLLDGVQKPENVHGKWCGGGSDKHWVIVDLSASCKIYKFVTYDCLHAESGWPNFKNYKILVSNDLQNWELVTDETGREESIKTDYIKPTIARYVKFQPYDNTPFTVRIYEFEIWGVEGKLRLSVPTEPILMTVPNKKNQEISFGLNGEERNSNFAIDISSSNNDALKISNAVINESTGKATFDMQALDLGNFKIDVKFTNGEWIKSALIDVKVSDESYVNVARGTLPIIVESTEPKPNEDINKRGEEGMVDGKMDTYWIGGNDGKINNASTTFTIDLTKVYDIRSFKLYFPPSATDFQKSPKLPSDIRLYVGNQDNEDSYRRVSWTRGTDINTANEIILSEVATGQFIKAVIKPKASAPGDFYLKELEVLAKANSKNTLEIAHFATAKISAGKTLNKEIEYSLGGAVMADNIEAKVVSNNEQVVLVKNVLLNKNTNKIEFTLEGVVKGKARVMISLKNGDWSYHSGVDVQILDLGNLAQGKKVTANPAGIGGITGTLSVITDGIIPPAGVNGNTEWGKYWVSQDAGRLKTAVIVDLEENYLVNGIKLFTTTTQYVADYLAGLEAYVGKEDNAASYKKVDMPFYSYQTEYTAAINPAVEGRYVKLILENGDNYQGVAVREIEVSGSVIEPPVNITKINVPTTLIYPNPIVQGETLNVKVDNAKVIKLVTIQGNIVSETNAQPEVTSISTGGIQRGVYLLIVETENGNKVEKITII